MTDEIDQVNQNDDQLLKHQLAIIFEYLINIAQFDLPYILVLLDKTDNMIGGGAASRKRVSDVRHPLIFTHLRGHY